MDAAEIRRRAVSEAIRRNPELADASTAEELARLNEIANQIEPGVKLQYDLEEMRRQEFAEQAAEEGRKAEAERQRQAEVERVRLEEQRAQRAREREERTAAMPPFRRFLRRNRIAVAVGAIVFVIAPAITGAWILVQENERRNLLASCDWNNFERIREYSNWATEWINCSDPLVRVKVLEALRSGRDNGTLIAFLTSDRVNQLSSDESIEVRYEVAKYAPATTLSDEVVLNLSRDTDEGVVNALLTRDGVSENIQTSLVEVTSAEQRRKIASDPGTSSPVLAKLAEVGNGDIHTALLNRGDLPDAAWLPIISKASQDLLTLIAGREDLPESGQRLLVEANTKDILRELALNPNLASDVRAAFPKCAEGGPCFLGDVGPGGGTVLVIWGAQMPWGRYLEIAPTGWSGPKQDPPAPLCPSVSKKTMERRMDIPYRTNFGSGVRATARLMKVCGPDSAAALATRYQGGGLRDWFLPNEEELKKSIANSKRHAVDLGLLPDTYWTSTFFDLGELYLVGLDPRSGSRAGGFRPTTAPDDKLRVRPSRAFD